MKVYPKLSIVYDITKMCPWNCKICCMGATSSCEALNGELSLERKLSLMDDIAEVNKKRKVHIDFSGGEILTNMDNILVVEKAACLLGKENVGISGSGFMVSDELANRLSCCISDFEMTMDVVPGSKYALRPLGYAKAAATALPFLQKHEIRTGIQTVLAHSNCNEENLCQLYDYLCKAGVDDWSLLKFYPSGRGINYKNEVLTKDEEAWAVDFIKKLDKNNKSDKKPHIDFHYTMKGHEKYSSECRCVRKSIGIMPDGSVTACFWALNTNTGDIDPRFLLGSVQNSSLNELLNGDKAAYWMNCKHKCELSAA